LIAQSLATLYLLNLDGCPAADTVGKTAKLWVRLLWDKPRSGWHEQADSERIRNAFAAIAETCRRWPSPAVFWDLLPKRAEPNPNTTIGPGWGREREREALQARDAWLKQLGLNHAGEPLEGAK
jgi:hypothetical protein